MLYDVRNLSINFGTFPVLNKISFQIQEGERICLLGRNGEGKSTLLKIITGSLAPDTGEIVPAPQVWSAYLPQDIPADMTGKVRDIVQSGLAEHQRQLQRFEEISLLPHPTATQETERHALETWLHTYDGWSIDLRVEKIISQMELPADELFETLSTGWKRRVLLARALVQKPNLLILDEPTNHLDIPSIQWMEKQLQGFGGAILFVTHDRSLIRSLSTRIMELDRGNIYLHECDYESYLLRKEQRIATEEKQTALFDKKLAQEEDWIRQGIKARRTRNEGRVRRLKELRKERKARRVKAGVSNIRIQASEQSGDKVIEAENISFAYPEKKVFARFSTLVTREDKIGIVGANGAGKSTLLRVLLGQLAPSTGKITLGTNLQIAYFDQLRAQLDENKSVRDNVADLSEYVQVGGSKKHVIGYLQDFLFSPERANTPVRALSGGEKNRLLLARLLARPANLLVLDEPTNDLDMETLELLEARLVEYDGTVIVVSHDRTFLNNVVTTTMVIDEKGEVTEHVGSIFEDEETGLALLKSSTDDETSPAPAENPNPAPEKKPALRKRKLSYKEQTLYAQLPSLIEKLEEEQSSLQEEITQPAIYSNASLLREKQTRLIKIEQELEEHFTQWQELEEIAEA